MDEIQHSSFNWFHLNFLKNNKMLNCLRNTTTMTWAIPGRTLKVKGQGCKVNNPEAFWKCSPKRTLKPNTKAVTSVFLKNVISKIKVAENQTKDNMMPTVQNLRDKNTLGYMDRKCFVTRYTDKNTTEFMNVLDIDLTAKLQDLSDLQGLQCTFGLKIKHF